MHRKTLVSFLALMFLTAAALSARNLFVPVAGSAPGANDTYFRTDLRLFNPSPEMSIMVTLHYLPRGVDGTNISGRTVTIAPRQIVVLDDVVATFLEQPVPTVGAIRIDSNDAVDRAVIATSRTYTDTAGSTGTYGQFIPALDAATARQKSVVLHITQSADLMSGFRTNAGVMNPGREPVVVTPTVISSDGTVERGPDVTVPPLSMIQVPLATLKGTQLPVDDGFILFESTAPVFTYASVVDNVTGDQFFVTGQEDSAEVRPLP